MNRKNTMHIYICLVASSLLLGGLFFLLSRAPQVVQASPDDLFVTTDGIGTDCIQANPCNLATALSQSVDGDTIYVGQGTYTGTGDAVISVLNNVTHLGGWDGSPTTPPVRDPDTYPTTLDGENNRRVVYIDGDIAPTLEGFIITRGDASTAAVDPGFGGGIYSIQADPIITNNKITDNVAFTSTAEWGNGGGIFISNSNGIPGSAVICNNLIANNKASSASRGNGGGLHVDFSLDIVISDNTFQGNIAGSYSNGLGGGVALFESSAVVTGNWIQDNQASPANSAYGGGFYSQNGDITLNRNQIINNIAVFGAVTFLHSPNITVTNNMIAQNTGGGVFVQGSAATSINGILAHNTIAQNGGNGVCAGCSSPGYVTLTLTNNIITGQTTGIFAYPDSNTSVVTATHTLFFDNDANTDGATIISTNEITGSDPHFLNSPLGNHHLWPNSPAIDAGTTVPWLMKDIDGDVRPWPTGGDYDIGADEAVWLTVYLPVVMNGSQ